MSYHSKYTRFGDISDLENAVATFELCLTLLPEPSFQKAVCLANFGESLSARFDQKKDIADINRAILLLETSISLVGEGETTPFTACETRQRSPGKVQPRERRSRSRARNFLLR
jgi:hypothetical protein